MVSNTTDSSIRKPTDTIDHIEDSTLPAYSVMQPVNPWKTQEHNSHMAFNSLDYPQVDVIAATEKTNPVFAHYYTFFSPGPMQRSYSTLALSPFIQPPLLLPVYEQLTKDEL